MLRASPAKTTSVSSIHISAWNMTWDYLEGNDLPKAMALLMQAAENNLGSSGEGITQSILKLFYDEKKNGFQIGVHTYNDINLLLVLICYHIPEQEIKSRPDLSAIFDTIKERTGADIYALYNDKEKFIFTAIQYTETIDFVIPTLNNHCIDFSKKYICAASGNTEITLVQNAILRAATHHDYNYYLLCLSPVLEKLISHNRACLQADSSGKSVFDYWNELCVSTEVPKTFGESTIGRNKISQLFAMEFHLHKILLFLFAALDKSSFSILHLLPKELITEICDTAKLNLSNENNDSFMYLTRLLRGYCDLNDLIPARFTRNHKALIQKTLWTCDTPRTNTSGEFLYRLSREMPLDTIDKNDGLHYIFKMISYYADINITDFYPHAPLKKSLDESLPLLATFPFNMIIQILMRPEYYTNAKDALRLLLTRPYFSPTGKKGMIYSFLIQCDADNAVERLADLGDLISSTQHDLICSFKTALERNRYHVAIYIFCKATKQDTPMHYIKCDCTCPQSLLLKLMNDYTGENKPANSLLLIELLNWILACDPNLRYFSHHKRQDFYKLIIKKSPYISDWEALEHTFRTTFLGEKDKQYCDLIRTLYLNQDKQKYNKVITFFAGTKKYAGNAACSSSIYELPDEALNTIAAYTML